MLEALGWATAHDVMRRYQAYRALQQLMQDHPLELYEAIDLYPIFRGRPPGHPHVARLGRQPVVLPRRRRCSSTSTACSHRNPPPTAAPRAPASARSTTWCTCDGVGEPDALRMITEEGRTLKEAVDVINDGAFQQWTTQVSSVIGSMQWDRRRFEGNRR